MAVSTHSRRRGIRPQSAWSSPQTADGGFAAFAVFSLTAGSADLRGSPELPVSGRPRQDPLATLIPGLRGAVLPR